MLFLFEQKTAYEMRISDWSSDVCSSDLSCLALLRPGIDQIEADPFESILSRFQRSQSFLYVMRPAHKAQRCIVECLQTQGHAVHARRCEICESRRLYRGGIGFQCAFDIIAKAAQPLGRSAEHTSELQSLISNTYAAFCL